MFNNSRVAKSVRLACAFGTALAISTSGAAFAQDTQSNDDEVSVEKISVTGSRIARPELSTTAPVITVGAAEIERFGSPDLGSILAELPAVAAGSTLVGNNNSNADAGLSSPDLRSLGATRTLTLVNGKRHVAGSPFSNAVDTGAIPAAMIERIEVITGGASAIYGSDAVAGVINVILRDDYEGVELRATGSTDTEGVGAQNHTLSLLTGATSDDGRGNITFFASKSSINEVLIPDLQQADNWGSIVNPDDTGEDDGIPDRLRVRNVGSEMINGFGVINPFDDASRLTFSPDGTGIPQVTRTGTNSFAFGSFDQAYDTVFFTEDYENYVPDQETITFASTFRYDLTDKMRFYGDFKYVDKDIAQQFQPSFDFGGLSINVEDNVFLDDATRQTLLNNGQTTVPMARFFDDIGNRSASNDRRLFRVVGGFEGYFTLANTDFDYDVYYTHGQTSNVRKTLNDLIPSNLEAALDSVYDPSTASFACRSQVPDAQGEDYEDPAQVSGDSCVPFNPFGFGNNTAAAEDFISGTVTREDELTQDMYGATVSFDSMNYFELPGGPVGFAVGYEYREEEVTTTTDEFTKAGFFTNAATPDSFGGYDVEEFFVEVRLPVLSDVFLAKELTFDGAFRSAEYSHAGSADAWQLGFLWSPIEDVRLRGTIGEAVRAPNVDEAFSPQSPGFANINDPCDADNINDDPDRVGNCAALGIPVGFEANDNVSIDTLSGGNPDLFSEESESRTIGVVWTPAFVENLSVTLDWYDIEITDAITEVLAQDILDNCVDATGGPDAGFCSQVDRNAGTNDVELVRSGFINASAITTSGLEMQIRYTTDLERFDLPGELRFNIQGNKVNELNEFAFQDRPDEINVEDGEVGDPSYQFRTIVDYRIDEWSVNYTSRFIDRSALFDVSPGGDTTEDTDISYVGSIWTHDVSVNYDLDDNIELFLGVRNLTNKVPPGYTFDALYDLVGRRVNAGVTVRFE